MSSSWYAKAPPKQLTKIGNTIRNIADANQVTNAGLVWCVPGNLVNPTRKGARKVSPRGFTAGTGEINDEGIAQGCYLACTARATNAYRDRSVIVHAFNRFPHVSVSSFLQDYGVEVDNNQFALSELVQFVWRTQIRDGKPIKLCILSKRVRKLFQDWLYDTK